MTGAFACTGCSAIVSTFTFQSDAGRSDAGAAADSGDHIDSGRRDAGEGDGAVTDSGVDAGSTCVSCGAACVDTESDPLHCGGCDQRCPDVANAAPVCGGLCGFICASGYADCNSTDADGCEAELGVDADHCGECGRGCPTGLSCRAGNCGPTLVWARAVGGPGGDQVSDLAFDSSGNLYVVGSGAGDFGGGPRAGGGGLGDAFVASYGSDGVHRWSLVIGGTETDSATSVAVDSGANVYFTGTFAGSLDIGAASPVVSRGSSDIYVASYTSDGTPRWLINDGATTTDYAHEIGVDAVGNAYVAGTFARSGSFGGDTIGDGVSGDQVFVASYTASGVPRWGRQVGSVSVVRPGLAVDVEGNAFVGAVEHVFPFSSGGTPRTAIAVWGGGTRAIFSLSRDGEGNFYMTGRARPETFAHLFLMSTTAAGALRWSEPPVDIPTAGPNQPTGAAIEADAVGNLHVLTNPPAGGISLESRPLVGRRGTILLNGSGTEVGSAMASNSSGLLCVVGRFTDSLTIGTELLIASGADDGLIACFDYR